MTFKPILEGFGGQCIPWRPPQRFVWDTILTKSIEPMVAVLVITRRLGRSTGQTPNRLNNLTV
jgi:hypothetical protein